MSTTDLPKFYDPKQAYETYYEQTENAGLFTPDPSDDAPPFSIVIPPPNVTGSLHMGHALNNTLQDVLIRYKRMDGYNALWIPGTDHAGIATQWIVEKQLRAEGLTKYDLGREKFLERVWKWKEESGGNITHQLRRLGVSCDWSRERFTLDDGCSLAVREVFVRLYEEGLIYRAERLINWDPIAQTALSNLEVENEEDFQTEIWSFAYPLENPVVGEDGVERTEIVVATTRPETMLGDTAVAVHPEDPRYKVLIGTNVRHPFQNRLIPIVGDAELVDPEFGTGAVKITPAHDFNDFEVGKRHDLPMINIMNKDGSINDFGGQFSGMDRFVAREEVKKALEKMGLSRGSKEHIMALPRSQRSNAPVEPMLSTQWFVDMKPLAKPALEAVESGKTNFVPKQWENTYFAWLRDIQDWCISRQLWWGHRIPAWHCQDCGEVTVSKDDATKCSHCGSQNIEQDVDVLDTWFSSALWPFSTMGWPEQTAELKKYYPTSVLITGFDIIFFWVARMMFDGIHFMKEVPFHDVYIHALVRDEHGQKMSKTKGNVVDPLIEIEKHGVDAFRMTLVALAAQGRDILWNDKRAEGYVKFQNKIWQAFRFLKMHIDSYDPNSSYKLQDYDNWILARTHESIKRVRAALDEYRFNDAASEMYTFIWDEFCSWYIEFCKGTLYNDNDPEFQQGARHTLLTVFHAITRMIHPIMPFLSEELWSLLPQTSGFVMCAKYPKETDFLENAQSLIEVEAIQQVITEVRRVRSEMQLAGKVELTLRSTNVDLLRRHAVGLDDLCHVTKIEEGDKNGPSVTIVVQGREIFIPLAGVIDLDAEKDRLDKEIQASDKDISFLEKRLANPKYVERAPVHLVQESKDKLAEAIAKRDSLCQARRELG